MLIPFLFEFVIILALIIELSNDVRNVQSVITAIVYTSPSLLVQTTTLVINSKPHKLV